MTVDFVSDTQEPPVKAANPMVSITFASRVAGYTLVLLLLLMMGRL